MSARLGASSNGVFGLACYTRLWRHRADRDIVCPECLTHVCYYGIMCVVVRDNLLIVVGAAVAGECDPKE